MVPSPRHPRPRSRQVSTRPLHSFLARGPPLPFPPVLTALRSPKALFTNAGAVAKAGVYQAGTRLYTSLLLHDVVSLS